MKLLKLSEEHYIIADKLDIKVGDWITDTYFVYQWKDDSSLLGRMKVTHSTEPIEFGWGQEGRDIVSKKIYNKVNRLSLLEVKELLGVVDVEKKAYLAAQKRYRLEHIPLQQIDEYGGEVKEFVKNFIVTYNQALEDNKEKKYTEEDIVLAFTHCAKYAAKCISTNEEADFYIECEKYLSSIQHPTEWEVEIIDGKLKLK